MKHNVFLISLFILFGFHSLHAQNDTAQVNLSSVEVNAHKNKLYSELGRVLTVIDKVEISRASVQSIDQLLDYVAGIDIRQRGTNGTQADISIRGGSFDQVLVLLNGVNVTDPQTGHLNFDIPIELSDVTRIEILQGSAARVLGPNAFSGAINIVTEKDAPKSLSAQVVVGSNNFILQNASASFGNNKIKSFASISHKESAGYMANTDFDFVSAYSQSVLKTAKSGKFDLQLAAQHKGFGANGFYSLAYPNQYEYSSTYFAALNWSMQKGKLSYSSQAYWRRHNDRFELDFNKPAGWNYHKSDVIGGKASAAILTILGKTTLGVDLRNEHIFSNRLGTVINPIAVKGSINAFFTREGNRLISTALFDHSVNIGKVFLSGGAALTHCDAFGKSLYGGADIAYAFTDNAKVFVSVNSATRLPTFNDLYYTSPKDQGDPTLKPEHSKTIEIGTKINQSQWRVNASVFYRNGEDVIDWVKMDDNTATKYVASNLGTVNAKGADLLVEYTFKNQLVDKIAMNYSYLDLDKAAVGFDSKYALDYLKNKFNMSLTHKIFGHLSASWKASYYDRAGTYKLSSTTPSIAFEPYYLIDTRILWSMQKYDVYADFNNLLDKSYADYGGLTQPGRNVNVGVRFKL